MFKAPWRALSALALLTAIGCGDDGGTEPEGSISVSASPTALSVPQGGTGTVNVTLTRGGGFAAPVNVTVEGLPTGVTAAVNPTSLTGTTTTAVVTVTVANSVAPGNYTATVRASATGIGAATSTYTLTVTAAGSYTLTGTAASIAAGASGTSTIAIQRTNFTGPVTLTLDNPPAGITATFNPAAPTGATSAATVNVASTVAPGNYTLTIKGTATGIADKTTTLAVTVAAAQTFTISAAPTTLTIAPGANSSSNVTIVRSGLTADVALSLVSPPTGITGTFTPATLTGTTLTSALQINVAGTVAPGTYPITVQGVGGSVTQTTTINVTVAAGSTVTLAMQPATLTIQQGLSGQATLNLTRTNFTGNVTPSVTGNPAGMTVTFNPTPITGNSSNVTVAVGSGVAPGTYNLTITGAAGTAGNPTTTLAVTVTAPAGGDIVWEFCNNEGVPLKFWRLSGGTWSEVAPTVVGNVTRFSFSVSGTQAGVAWTQSVTGAMVRNALRTTSRSFSLGNSRQLRRNLLEARLARSANQEVGLTSPYFDTQVYLALASELSGLRFVCDAPTAPTLVSKTFTLTGLGASEMGSLGYGPGSASLTPNTGSYNVQVPSGTYDWMAAFAPQPVFPNLATNWSSYRIGRGEAAPGGSVAINRTGATPFVTVPFTITGATPGAFSFYTQSLSGARGEILSLQLGDPLVPSTTGNLLFLAANDRLPTDMNVFTAFSLEDATSVQNIRGSFRYLGSAPPASATFALAAAVPAFTVAPVAGAPVPTWSVTGAIPADYQTTSGIITTSFQGAGGTALYTITATRGWLSANNMNTSYTLTGPTLPGFLAQWAAAAPLIDADVTMYTGIPTAAPVAGTAINFAARFVSPP